MNNNNNRQIDEFFEQDFFVEIIDIQLLNITI